MSKVESIDRRSLAKNGKRLPGSSQGALWVVLRRGANGRGGIGSPKSLNHCMENFTKKRAEEL